MRLGLKFHSGENSYGGIGSSHEVDFMVAGPNVLESCSLRGY